MFPSSHSQLNDRDSMVSTGSDTLDPDAFSAGVITAEVSAIAGDPVPTNPTIPSTAALRNTMAFRRMMISLREF
ncbi:hypothetical protein [Nonomuraea sp. NPDC003201]